jgi:hypothetical protein
VARIHSGVISLVFALIGGLGLFLMTVWLLIRGGPNVGLHLRLLGNYFPGYSVSWIGSLLGLIYGAIVGALVGWTIGMIYNLVVRLRNH